jgi:hypothetical protein
MAVVFRTKVAVIVVPKWPWITLRIHRVFNALYQNGRGLSKQLSHGRGAVVEGQPFGRLLTPYLPPALEVDTGLAGVFFFDAGGFVEGQDFLQCNPENLPEFAHVLGVISLPKLAVQGHPRNTGGLPYRDTVKTLRKPCVDVEGQGAM